MEYPHSSSAGEEHLKSLPAREEDADNSPSDQNHLDTSSTCHECPDISSAHQEHLDVPSAQSIDLHSLPANHEHPDRSLANHRGTMLMSSPPKRASLLGLPRELRDMIFASAIDVIDRHRTQFDRCKITDSDEALTRAAHEGPVPWHSTIRAIYEEKETFLSLCCTSEQICAEVKDMDKIELRELYISCRGPFESHQRVTRPVYSCSGQTKIIGICVPVPYYTGQRYFAEGEVNKVFVERSYTLQVKLGRTDVLSVVLRDGAWYGSKLIASNQPVEGTTTEEAVQAAVDSLREYEQMVPKRAWCILREQGTLAARVRKIIGLMDVDALELRPTFEELEEWVELRHMYGPVFPTPERKFRPW